MAKQVKTVAVGSALEAAAKSADGAEPTYVRLLGIAARAGGRLLPIGVALRVGVDIPEALAARRLAEETAVAVLPSAMTATALKAAVAAFAATVRSGLDEIVARSAELEGAELLELIQGTALMGLSAAAEVVDAHEVFQAAVDAHEAAVATEAMLADQAAAPQPDTAQPETPAAQ